MRKRLKLLCSLFIAMFVFSTMSMAVVADTQLVQSGIENDYSWNYYSDNELVINCDSPRIHLGSLSEFDFFDSVETLTLDFTNLHFYWVDDIYYFDIEIIGANIPASHINIIDNNYEIHHVSKLEIIEFNNLAQGKCISVPKSYNPYYIRLSSLNISSLDVFSDFDISSTNQLDVAYCDSLIDVSISGTYIGFESCVNLKSIVVSGTDNTLSVFDCDSLQSIDLTENNYLGVSNCDALSSITAPDSTEDIYINDCKSLLSVTAGSSINRFEISNCETLKEVNLPDGIDHVRIDNCPVLTEFDIPNDFGWMKLTDVGIEEIFVPESGEFFIRSESLKKAIVPSGLSTIENSIFYDCINLSEVEIPDTVTSIGESAFRCCYSLKSIDLPDSVQEIQPLAFGYSGLESIKLPASLTFIEYYSFVNCKSLQSVTIPTSVKCIDTEAFYGCSKLTDVYYEGTEAEWNQIEVDPDDIPLKEVLNNATIHFESDAPSGWVQDGNDWFYYEENSNKASGWKNIDGTWYDFDSNGLMLKGWQKSGSDWYYLGNNGAMRTGWQSVGGKWYYFNTSGQMKTGWFSSGDKWYYFNSNGDMATGWVEVDGLWYYFSNSGDMKTGWQKINGKWFYLKSNGSMAAGEYVNGYWINADGSWTYQPVAKWYKDGTGWYYMDSSKWYVKNDTVMIDGKEYSFNSAGYWIE